MENNSAHVQARQRSHPEQHPPRKRKLLSKSMNKLSHACEACSELTRGQQATQPAQKLEGIHKVRDWVTYEPTASSMITLA